MTATKQQFIELCLEREVLRFGEFTLKSGRISPYFFNAGRFSSGASLAALGRHYAVCIEDAGLPFDMLFGPAYKGIPLAASIAIAFADQHGRDLPYAYNRKEAKDHGEGGRIVGAPLAGRVLVVDDVISAGTSVRESLTLIQNAGAQLAGVAIALDRQERGSSAASAVDELRRDCDVEVIAIAALDDLIQYLAQDPSKHGDLARMTAYRKNYGSVTGSGDDKRRAE